MGYQLLQNGTAAAAAAAAAHHENSFGKVENIDFRRELSCRNQKKLTIAKFLLSIFHPHVQLLFTLKNFCPRLTFQSVDYDIALMA